jgi:hypothetical protein
MLLAPLHSIRNRSRHGVGSAVAHICILLHVLLSSTVLGVGEWAAPNFKAPVRSSVCELLVSASCCYATSRRVMRA